MQSIYKVWKQFVRDVPIFERVHCIAKSLIREYFGNHKPLALIRCFELQFMIATSLPSAHQMSVDCPQEQIADAQGSKKFHNCCVDNLQLSHN